MNRLILVKHSLPEIIPDIPARRWRLADEGRRLASVMAGRLAEYRPAAVVSSVEPKAAETAEIVAERLGVPWSTATGLHEHERTRVPFLGIAEFEAKVAEFFECPAEIVLGEESADQAHARFSAAVRNVLDRHPEQTLIILTHGTVLTLFLARRRRLEPFGLWKRLGLPSYVVLSLPELDLLSIVERIESS